MLHGRLRLFLGFGAHHIKEALSLGLQLFLCWRVLSALLTFVLRRLRGATLSKAMVSFMSVLLNVLSAVYGALPLFLFLMELGSRSSSFKEMLSR
jgi:hypothetical protein